MNRLEPAPNPAAITPAARPRLSGNHFNATPMHPQYTMAAPTPATAYEAYNVVSDCACPNPAQPSPHMTPAMVIRTLGPRLSIIQPHSDMAQVSSAMNSVQPHWTSDSFQPVALVSGPVNSVQPYCGFAIMIIAVTAAPS